MYNISEGSGSEHIQNYVPLTKTTICYYRKCIYCTYIIYINLSIYKYIAIILLSLQSIVQGLIKK